ncbi:MAG: secretion system protein E [Methanosarcinales archaeon]|nr:MAG: secretion system protein E [Methanosarcinales archaeon]
MGKLLKILKKQPDALPPYDRSDDGFLVEFEVPDGATELERYWVDEPYAFVSILNDSKMLHYYMVEPSLTAYEKAALDRLHGDLQDILARSYGVSETDMDAVLTRETLSLLKYYHVKLSPASVHKILYYLRRNFRGYDRLNPVLMDPYIEDISCDGIDVPVFLYHQTHRNIRTNIVFGELDLNSFVIKLCQKSGKQISIGEPMVDATMPDGSRLQATLGKEVTTRGSSFTIRKFRGDPITPIDLVNFGTCSADIMAYFWLAIDENKSMIFAGGTASGKTSILNAVSLFIPPLTKVISIEDTRELTLHHDNWIAAITRKSFAVSGAGEVTMYDLLRAALRQRPEYILVGEVRGAEALTLFQAMSTGHTTYSTMHAGDVPTVVNRLESDPINVPHAMLQSLDIICIQAQTYVNEVRARRTQNIVEIAGLDPKTGNIRINELYRWEPLTDAFKHARASSVLDSISKTRGWTRDTMLSELVNRVKILEYMRRKGMRDYVGVSLVVQAYATNPELVMSAVKTDRLQELISENE